jgi:hypothetical protein
MAIRNYNDLLVAATNWLARDDLSSRIPEFVALAEAACNREFRVRAMERRAQAETVAGQAVYAWPADLLEIRSIKVAGSPPIVLEYLNPERIEGLGAEMGTPRCWSDMQAALRLWPVPVGGLAVEIDYYQRLDLANAGEDGNWLIRRHPDIYLYGTLLQSEPYLMNDGRTQTWAQLLNAAVDQMQREEWRIKAGAMPAMVRADYRGA